MDNAPSIFEMIAGRESPDCYIELRTAKPGEPMRQWFLPLDAPTWRANCERLARRMAEHSDVFIGAAPRIERFGGKSAVRRAWCLWADCDTPESVERLRGFAPSPTLTVRSGSPGRVHAWWSLEAPASAAIIERANARLAFRLGADPKCAEVARILRVPGTLNYKHEPPADVVAEGGAGVRHSVVMVADLPDPSAAVRTPSTVPRRLDVSDALLGISPLEYVPRLSGREPNSAGYVKCPTHGGGNERTPSLKVYADPSKGWHCFGCGLGGTVYDYAAAVWGLPTRGDGFLELKDRLTRELL